MAQGDLRLSGVVTVNVPSVAEIADGVWDEALAGHALPGSTGLALAESGGVADPLTKAVPGAYAAGTGGAALGRLLGQQVTVVSPLSRQGVLTVVRGDSYLGADGRAIVLPSVEGDAWPNNLTGWALKWAARPYAEDGVTVEASTVTAVPLVAPGQALRVELAAAVTGALVPGARYRWDVQATKVDSVVTLRRGALEVVADAA